MLYCNLALKSDNMIGLIAVVRLRERWRSLLYAKSREYLVGQLCAFVTEKKKRKIKSSYMKY